MMNGKNLTQWITMNEQWRGAYKNKGSEMKFL